SFVFIKSLISSFKYPYLLFLLLYTVSFYFTSNNLLPQFSQKEASTEFEKPQFGHTIFLSSDNLFPQFSQKSASLEFSVPHLLHFFIVYSPFLSFNYDLFS